MTQLKDKLVEDMTVDEKLTKIIEQNQDILTQQEEIIEKLDNVSRVGGDYSTYEY